MNQATKQNTWAIALGITQHIPSQAAHAIEKSQKTKPERIKKSDAEAAITKDYYKKLRILERITIELCKRGRTHKQILKLMLRIKLIDRRPETIKKLISAARVKNGFALKREMHEHEFYKKIIKLRKAGYMYSQISAMTGATRTQVTNCIYRHRHRSSMYGGIRESKKNKYISLFRSGKTNIEIAIKMNVTEKHVRQQLKRYTEKGYINVSQ